MKRAIIVHCWEGYPEYCWYPWVKSELEKRGFQVEVPAFPETDSPEMEKWVPHLAQAIGESDEDLYLTGHSIGCAAIMRYLENLPEGKKIGGAVFVAGYTDNLGYEEIKSFFETPFDFGKIKSMSKNGFIAIHSDNDPYVDLKHADIFKDKLGAEVIIKHDAGHFSGSIENEKACLELPDVVESIEKLTEK
ncbi:MAG: alpha/beta hydrolase [Parcubacteria group bacterium]|jgi:hypothetical protein